MIMTDKTQKTGGNGSDGSAQGGPGLAALGIILTIVGRPPRPDHAGHRLVAGGRQASGLRPGAWPLGLIATAAVEVENDVNQAEAEPPADTPHG